VSLCIPSSSRSPDHDPYRTIYYLGFPLCRFAGLKHRQLARQVGVIITTGRIRRILVNKINLLVDSPRSIEAIRLSPVKAGSIFLRRASGCFGTSRDSSHGSSSTTSSTPRVRVPRLVAQLVTRLVAPLIVGYSTLRRLVVNYFTYAARPVASARRAARRATRRATRHTAHHRLLRLRRASGCLGSLRGSSRGSSSTTSTTPHVRVPRLIARLVTRHVVDYFDNVARPGASAYHAAHHMARRAARRRLLHLAQARRRLLLLRRASGCFGTSRGSSHGLWPTTSTTPHIQLPRLVARLVTRLVVDYFDYTARPGALARCTARHMARRRLLRLRRASRCLGTSRGSSRRSSSTTPPRAGSSLTTLTTPHVQVPRHIAWLISPLVVDYFASAARLGASARRAARRAARRRLLCLAQACRRLLHIRHVSGCFGTSRGLSRDSSSTTSPRTGSLPTTSPPPRVLVPRHIARLVTRLVVDYFASRRLIVDYFTYAARPVASACRAARHAARHRLLRLAQARRRLLHLRRASGCFSTSRGLSHDSSSTSSPRAGSSSTTSPTPRVRVPRHVARLVVDYFDYAACPVASARRAARRTARRAARRRLLRLAQARHRLLRLRRASGCLGTSRGSSRRSPSTTSPTLRVRVPRHIAQLVTRLVVNYSVCRDFVLRPHWLYFNHAVRRDYLSHGNTGSTSTTPRAAATSSFGRIASTIHLD
jgi:hypothetical protein